MQPIYTGLDQHNQQVYLYKSQKAAHSKKGEPHQLIVESDSIHPHPSLLPRKSLKNWKVWSLKTGGLLFHFSELHHLVQAGVRKVKLIWKKQSEELPLWAVFGCSDFCEALRRFKPTTSWLSSSTLPHIKIDDCDETTWVILVGFLKGDTKHQREQKISIIGKIDALLRIYKLARDKTIPLLFQLTEAKIKSTFNKTLTEHNSALVLELTTELELTEQSDACLKFIKEQCFQQGKYTPLGYAIVQKKIPLLNTLLATVEMSDNLAQDCVDQAISTNDAAVLQTVLEAVKKEKTPGLLKKHKKAILRDSHPERWQVIYNIYPLDWFQTKDGFLDFQVIREGKLFWIKHFDKKGLYTNKPIFHHIVEKCGAERVNLFANAVKDVVPLLQIEEGGQTAFGAAMRNDRPQMVAALLGLHIHHKIPIDPKAFTAKHPGVIDSIISNGLQEHKDALLTWAIFLRPQGPHPKLAYRLLEAGASPSVTWKGTSILDKLYETKLFKMGAYFINKKQITHAAIQKAVNGKRWDWIALFIKHNIDLDWEDEQGRGLLHYAAEAGEEELCKELEKKHLDPWKQDVGGTTPHDLLENKNLFSPTIGD